ncbi:YbaK/EbsC family protein [Ferrimicrobium sp.]|uniref:YbaK/EbsC family protein n=1 Tax=Ferrimicrobium sp. TaxID=2926050 RepID=UPI002611BACD|nr:YbaK/EbsC family protein [Ferrimicrobium sp.]
MDPLQRVRDALCLWGLDDTIQAFGEGTHTAVDAARAIGCEVNQIAKSIVFATADGPMIVMAGGTNRIDKRKVGRATGMKLHSVGADYLRERLELEPGGVTPLATDAELPVVIDSDLFTFDQIWLSAGTPSHILSITPEMLRMITRAQIMAVTEVPSSSS